MNKEDNCIGNVPSSKNDDQFSSRNDGLFSRNYEQFGDAYLVHDYANGNFVGFTPSTIMASEEQNTFIDGRLLDNSSFSSLLRSMVTPPVETNLSHPWETITSPGGIFCEYSVSRNPNLAPMTPDKSNMANEDRSQLNVWCLETNKEGSEDIMKEQVVLANFDTEVIDTTENEVIDSNKKVQSKTKRKKHRPRVITERRPKAKKKEFTQKRKYTKRKGSKDEFSVLIKDENKPKKPRTPRKRKQPINDATFQIPETPDKVENLSKRNKSLILSFHGDSISYASDFRTPEMSNNQVVEIDAYQSSVASHSSGDVVDVTGFSSLLMAQEKRRVRRSLNFSRDEGIKSSKEFSFEIQSEDDNRCSFSAIKNLVEMSTGCLVPSHFANRTDDARVYSNIHEPMKDKFNSQICCFSSKDNSFPIQDSEHGFCVSHSCKEMLADGSHSELQNMGNGVDEKSESLNAQALVVYPQNNELVPLEKVKRRQRSKVLLDERTIRVWQLLMDNINNEGVDGNGEEETAHWRYERKIFLGRANNFIAKMHLVQGDRRFSCWKGSVVDSVVGVFLTQNVADNLSSSAFMSMAARFPNKVKGIHEMHDACFSDKGKEVEEIYDSYFSEGKQVQESFDGFYEFYKTVEAAIFSTNSYDNGSETSNNGLQKSNEAPKSDCGDSSHASNEAKEPQRNSNLVDSNSSQESSLKHGEEHEAKDLQTNASLVDTNGSQESSLLPVEASGTKEPQMNSYLGDSNGSQESSFMLTCDDKNPSLSALSGIATLPNYDSMFSEEANMRKLGCETVGNNSIAETAESMQKAIDLEKKMKKINEAKRKAKSRRVGDDIKENFDWSELRKQTIARTGKTQRSAESKDTLDWEAVRCADIEDVADTIRERGMNNMLAQRIKAFLDKLMTDFGSIDLEWIRDIAPDQAKEYLLTIKGLGLKSVECVRLLTLHQHAFPVDTNVGRIAVRLGWVPIHPLPESLQLHLLELYPILDSIQKYLWPRLCKLDQATLYELHYQMITFGKVFCTKSKPNCNACPMRAECRHFASAFASARLALPSSSAQQTTPPTAESLSVFIHKMFSPTRSPVRSPIIELPPDSPQRPLQIKMADNSDSDDGDIPAIPHNMDNLTQNLQEFMNIKDSEDLSKAIVALNGAAAHLPTPKLKNISRLRTEHLVYEIPDSHPLVQPLEAREPDDPSFYLFAMWSPGEVETALNYCDHDHYVFGTLLIPCRTAMRGTFPLNGTYFQVNEVFADHVTSHVPVCVPRELLWNLHRRTVYFGTSVSTIFKGLSTEEIQRCFWRGFVCVRGFDRETRAPRPLIRRLHLAASKVVKEKGVKKKRTPDI